MNEFISSLLILYETLFAINNDDISKILSNSFNPFSLRVLPDSTISTIKSETAEQVDIPPVSAAVEEVSEDLKHESIPTPDVASPSTDEDDTMNYLLEGEISSDYLSTNSEEK